MNEDLIKVLRCEYYGDDECDRFDCPIWSSLGCRNGIANRAAADALEAADKKIAELEKRIKLPDRQEFLAKGSYIKDPLIRPNRIMGYDAEKLILFAKMCKENDVTEHDLKQAAWNLELAVRAVMNERAEIVKNTMDEITMRFTPDFEKAFEEMRGEHDG